MCPGSIPDLSRRFSRWFTPSMHSTLSHPNRYCAMGHVPERAWPGSGGVRAAVFRRASFICDNGNINTWFVRAAWWEVLVWEYRLFTSWIELEFSPTTTHAVYSSEMRSCLGNWWRGRLFRAVECRPLVRCAGFLRTLGSVNTILWLRSVNCVWGRFFTMDDTIVKGRDNINLENLWWPRWRTK